MIDVMSIQTTGTREFLSYLPAALWEEFSRDTSRFALLGAVCDGAACGALAAQVENGDVYLRSLYVHPDYRGQGAGTALLFALLQAVTGAEELGSIIAVFSDWGDDGQSARLLLERNGFALEAAESAEYTMTLAQLESAPWSGEAEEGDAPFGDLPTAYFNELSAYLQANTDCPLDLPLRRELYDAELSFAAVSDLKITSAVFLERQLGGGLRLSWVFSRLEAAPLAAKTLYRLLQRAYLRAKELLSPETHLDICAVNSFSARLVERLCPQAEKRPLTRAVRAVSHSPAPQRLAALSIEEILTKYSQQFDSEAGGQLHV